VRDYLKEIGEDLFCKPSPPHDKNINKLYQLQYIYCLYFHQGRQGKVDKWVSSN